MTTQLKHGEVFERIVRQDHIGISELSRKLNVSRRTIYNWFGQDRLSHEVIWKVGNILGQDLSTFFPDIFLHGNLNEAASHGSNLRFGNESTSVCFWMNKYIRLLEKYNDLLSAEERKALEEEQPEDMPLRNRRMDSFLYQ